MIIPSREDVIKEFKKLSRNQYITNNPNSYVWILYYFRNLNCIKTGWCEPQQFGNNEDIQEIIIPKNRCTKLTNEEYDKYVGDLMLQIKQYEKNKLLKRIDNDFV